MYFQLRRDADKWFAGIEKDYPTKFDLYYLCLMAGLASGRKTRADPTKVRDLVDDYPGEFRSRGRLLVGVLLHTELASLGIDLTDQKAVHHSIVGLVKHNAPALLNDEGMRLMNQYANGGFEALCEWFEDRPRSTETFLRQYRQCVQELLEQRLQTAGKAEESDEE
jgi:hypothetical protein